MKDPPTNLGKKWSDSEIQQLLQGVKQKKTVQELATIHQRTPGGIHCRLKELAADYYYNDNRPIEDIMKFTGLDDETIADAISKRQWKMDQKEKQTPVEKISVLQMLKPTSEEPKKEGMISLLTEIRDLMKEMVELMKKS